MTDPLRERLVELVERERGLNHSDDPEYRAWLSNHGDDCARNYMNLIDELTELLAEPEVDNDEATRLRDELRLSNAVCACGCPDADHENYGEDGEACAHEDHECVPTSRAVLQMLNDLRGQVAAHGAAPEEKEGHA